MDRKIRAKITGLGSYHPSRLLTNADFEKMVDTSDEWITTRTGIKERWICDENESNSDMSLAAGLRALEMSGNKPEDIELLLIGTVTPDKRLPSLACVVQDKMGLVNATAVDVVAACAGFLTGLSMANAYIKAGLFKKIMVIGAEKLSSITDYTDRNTCVLFGDGAGAAIVEASDGDDGILSIYIKSDGRHKKLLWIPDGGSDSPAHKINSLNGHHFDIIMNGKEVFKHAVRMMADASNRVLADANLKAEDVNVMVPHQANIRIMKSTAKRLGIPEEKVFVNLHKYGNTSAASVPIAFDEAVRSGKIKKGDIVLMTAFGGGLIWGSAVVRW
ncbi:MAG TPA: ketoacyl-ACP synthase III [candidate division Zixibacteria bacterium]|nr:ketoacyl-ACP synthase III [candidate division Zixibacteria bacterium]